MSASALEASSDSLRHWGGSIGAMPGKVLAIDSYTKKWLQDDGCFSVAAELTRVALPQDSNAYASDYGYPAHCRWACATHSTTV